MKDMVNVWINGCMQHSFSLWENQLILSRGPVQEGGGVCMQVRSEGGNDQCILSH